MKNTGSQKLASRYVSALFEVADKANALDAVQKDLHVLAEAAETQDAFSSFLNNPLLTRAQSEEAMEAMLSKLGAHEVTRKFIATLARQKRLPALAMIAKLFTKAIADARGELSADLISASTLSPEDLALASQKLEKIYGKKVALNAQVKPEILGGLVVKIGSVQLDGSVAGKLDRLKNTLKVA